MKKNKINFCYYSKSSRISAGRSPDNMGGKKVYRHFNFFTPPKTAIINSGSKKDLNFKQSCRFFDKKINSVQLRGQKFKKIRKKINRYEKPWGKRLYGQNFYIGEIRRKISQSKTPYLQTSKNNKASIYKEYKLYYKQKVWYRDKAALLPGANTKFITAFVQKNKFYKKIYSAYKVFKKYYYLSKKSLLKQYKNRAQNSHACSNGSALSGAQANSMEFSMLMLMDSLYSSSMCKSGLVLNKHEKDIFRNYYSNGKSVHKKNFYLAKSNKAINKDGDFCIGANVRF